MVEGVGDGGVNLNLSFKISSEHQHHVEMYDCAARAMMTCKKQVIIYLFSS